MWNKEDRHLLRINPLQVTYRRVFQYTAWFLYGISRSCQFCKLRYKPQANCVEEFKFNRYIFKLIMVIKLFILGRQCVDYFVLIVAIYIHFQLVDTNKAQNFLMGLFMQGISVYVLRRMVIFLHSGKDRKFIQHVINEIFYITARIEEKFGIVYHCEPTFLGLYLLKLGIVYIMLESLWHKSYFLWINFIYWLLLEYCILAYFLYQLILLNWYRNIMIFLQYFIDHHERRESIEERFHRRLTWLFKLHLLITNLHNRINKDLAWLTSSIYLTIFTCIFNMELLIECAGFANDELENKIYIITDGCLGPVCIPLMNVLMMGLCTDSLRNSELILQQQIVIINELYMKKEYPNFYTLKVLNNEHSSLIIHQKLEPLQNVIILGTTCDREFAFDYLFTVITTALSLIQYTLSIEGQIAECATHK